MEAQVQHLCANGINACCVDFEGRSGHAYETEQSSANGSDEFQDSDELSMLKMSVSLDDISSGHFCFVYCHPESLLTKRMIDVCKTKSFRSQLCAVVVDEVHMISEWYTTALFALKLLL